MDLVARLSKLGHELPPVPEPAAAYKAYARTGNLVMTAGQLPVKGGVLLATGLVGQDVSVEQAQQLAQTCALNLLAIANEAADGDIDRVTVVKLNVFVASAPTFTEQHLVANGASLFMAEVLGEAGVHARSAVGVPRLPLDAPVEIEAVFEIE